MLQVDPELHWCDKELITNMVFSLTHPEILMQGLGGAKIDALCAFLNCRTFYECIELLQHIVIQAPQPSWYQIPLEAQDLQDQMQKAIDDAQRKDFEKGWGEASEYLGTSSARVRKVALASMIIISLVKLFP